jgi:hypothetical protein
MVISLSGNFCHSLIFRQTLIPAPPERVFFYDIHSLYKCVIMAAGENLRNPGRRLLKAAGDIR